MAHEHKLEIFRGLVKFSSNTRKIWGVLIFLSIVTAIEVGLGITKPAVLTGNYLIGMKLLNWIFIVLTLVKAYYIAWDFMHLRDEKTGELLFCHLHRIEEGEEIAASKKN